MANSEQHFFKTFGRTAPENYEKYFVPLIGRPLAVELVEIADIRPGERVLDVACGTGIVARLAAERVGTAGKVAAVDMNPGMLAVARSRAEKKPIEWHESDAQKLPLKNDSFDVIFCQLGLQFFQDRLAGLQEIRRVLSPGGRVLIRTAGPTPDVFQIFDQALERHVGPHASAFVQKIFCLYDRDEIERLLKDTGFHEISVRSEMKTALLPSPREFLWQYISSTPLEELVANATNEQRSALEDEVVSGWQRFVENEKLILKIHDVLTTAKK